MTEKIMCAAIWYQDNKKHPHQPENVEEGYVICGHRHHNIIYIQHLAKIKVSHWGNTRWCQGFLTDKNRFVDRVEAHQIAINSGQLKGKMIGPVLTSEDLW